MQGRGVLRPEAGQPRAPGPGLLLALPTTNTRSQLLPCMRRGVVHRDLKLDNLLLARRGDLESVVIADFG